MVWGESCHDGHNELAPALKHTQARMKWCRDPFFLLFVEPLSSFPLPDAFRSSLRNLSVHFVFLPLWTRHFSLCSYV